MASLAYFANNGGNLGVASGSTPLATCRELIRRHRAGEVTFKDCSFFALEEYVGLPIEHEQSYYQVIHNVFSDHVDVDAARVH
ncbi:glucosamine-6-phosphate deaminase, partial [Corynebacterium amycolatum]